MKGKKVAPKMHLDTLAVILKVKALLQQRH